MVRLGLQRYADAIQELKDPSGHLGFWISGTSLGDADPEEDVYWAHRGAVTLTPLWWNQTDFSELDKVRKTALGKI